MSRRTIGRVLMWLTTVTSCAAAALAFVSLYRLRNDPLSDLAQTFEFAAYLQPIPYVAAIVLAVLLRRRPEILCFAFAAVIGCGTYGWWWLDGLEEIRQIENEPSRRRALGNILPDIEGQFGSVKALLWPLAVIIVIAVATFVGWAAWGRGRRERMHSSRSA